MRCYDVRVLLWPFAKDELSASEAAAVRDHSAGCPDCARELAQVQQLVAAAVELPGMDPSIGVLLQTKEEVRLELERQGVWRVAFGPVMTPEEVARYLKVDVAAVYLHLHEMPHFELDGETRFRREAIDEWIAAGEELPRLAPRVVS